MLQTAECSGLLLATSRRLKRRLWMGTNAERYSQSPPPSTLELLRLTTASISQTRHEGITVSSRQNMNTLFVFSELVNF